MGNLIGRVAKLEMKKHQVRNQVWIRYSFREVDGKAGEREAKTQAIDEWESLNGPLGNAKPKFIARRIIPMSLSEILENSGRAIDPEILRALR